MTLNKFTSNSIGALQITHDKLHTDMDLSTKTLTMPTVIRGPATLTIDPATVGDNTGSVVIAGDLIVNGTTTTVNSNTVNIGDNLLVLNSDETGTPSQNSGIEIERGTSNNATLIWNETDDTFEVKVGTALADFRVETFTVTNINTTGSGSTNISAGANIELDATNRVLVTDTPFRLASMTTTQRNAIASPANGDMIYNSTTNQIESYENSSWTDTARSGSGFSSVVDDTTPQLGGDLDLNGNNITGTGNIELIDTTASVVYGPTIELYRNRTSPADGDTLGQLIFQGKDSSGNKSRFANIRAKAVSVTANSEDGQLDFVVTRNNNNDEVRLSIPSFAPTAFYRENVKLMAGVDLVFAGATDNANETILTVTDPTGANTITLPDATGTVLLQDSSTGLFTINATQQGSNYISNTGAFNYLYLQNSTSGTGSSDGIAIGVSTAGDALIVNRAVNSGAFVFNSLDSSGNYATRATLGDSNLTLSQNMSLIFEGATDDGNETTLTVTDPTADRTIKLPDNSGNIAVQTSDGMLQVEDTASNPSNLGININAVNSTSRSNFRIGPYSFDHWIIDVDPDQAENYSSMYFRVDNDFHMHLGAGNLGTPMNTMYKPIFFASGVGNSLMYAEGSTNDGNELEITCTDPTADRTITFPDLSGTLSVNTATDSSSIILGENSGTNATAATNTTVLGRNALTAGNLLNTTAIGKGALELLPSGNNNTAVGYNALRSTSSGSNATNNTAIGNYALSSTTTGDYNVGIGYNPNMPRGYYSSSVAIGNAADINGSNQVMIGNNAGGAVSGSYTYANSCIGIGDYAYYGNGNGDYNTMIGGQNMRQYYATSSFNVAVGYNAMRSANGGNNVALGAYSLYADSSSSGISNNVGIGYYAGRYNRGVSNTFIGHRAGHGSSTTYLTGSGLICIGRDAEPSSATISNEITLGNASITSLRCQVQAISSLSDERDKTAIEDLDLGLDFIKAMKPRKFTWNRRDGKYLGKQELGFIAQELYEVEQDFASTSRTRLVSFNNPSKLEAQPMNTYPILVKAIQELSAKVDSLQAEVNTLKNGG